MSHEHLCTLRMLTRRLRRYGIPRTWLAAEVQAGRLPCLRVGRRLLFDPQAVEQALLARARQTLEGAAP